MFFFYLSDRYEKLHFGGNEVQFEGGLHNRMLKNHEWVFEKGLADCKYDKDYMFVSVDTNNSNYPKEMEKSNLKYFIQDLKKDSVLKTISYKDLQNLIKEKSLDDIDITK